MTEPGVPPSAAVAAGVVAAQGVNPADAATVLKTLLDVYEAAAQEMVTAVARRLARGITTDGWAEAKARETLAIRDDLLGIVQRLDARTPQLVDRAMRDAYDLGQRTARTLDLPSIASRPGTVLSLAQRYTQQLRGTHVPVLRAHFDVYQRAVVDTELVMQTGTITRRDAIARSTDRLLNEGRDRFVDDKGRHWHLDAYARMAGRTVAGQVAVQGQLDRMGLEGRDIVLVSDSPRECPLCRPFEGKLLSISGAGIGQSFGARQVNTSVPEAIARGLQHPNCTHRLDPYVHGLTKPAPVSHDPEGYRNQQRLRGLERRSRDLKRRLAAAEQFGKQTPTARALRRDIRVNSAKIAAFVDETGQLRKRDRERPVGGVS